MSRSGIIFSKDEELGKKDDDHRPGQYKPTAWNWRGRVRIRKRRILGFAAALIVLWIVLSRIAALKDARFSTDSVYGGTRVPGQYGQNAGSSLLKEEPKGPPPQSETTQSERANAGKRYYNGRVRFYRLAESLQSAGQTMGFRPKNRNILFAVSSLPSVAALLPMACEMHKSDRNYVHFALFGREDVPIARILEINGINPKQCDLYWHDARPDFAEYSTDARMETSVSGAVRHIEYFVHPQAIVTMDLSAEDPFFGRAIKAKAAELGHPVIEISGGQVEKFMWMTRLDSGSLAAWHNPSIEILVQAKPNAAGSLVRTLKSLQQADYGGFSFPHLTIELPASVPLALDQFLQGFKWPPTGKPSLLSIRRRIAPTKLTPAEAPIRAVESFYPADRANSHVLLVSPHAELSPFYFHYMMYHLLEYYYSDYFEGDWSEVVGISLDVPSTYLNGSGTFKPPGHDADTKQDSEHVQDVGGRTPPFLYQAPSTTATLYLGYAWSQLHSFLSYRLAALKREQSMPPSRPKLVSAEQPAWTEFMLELMQARGWLIHYPASTTDNKKQAWVKIHTELLEQPEEFSNIHAGSEYEPLDQDQEDVDVAADKGPSAFMTASGKSDMTKPKTKTDLASSFRPLHALLPHDAELPEIKDLPILDMHGQSKLPKHIRKESESYTVRFRKEIGGCSTKDAKALRKASSATGPSAKDLFCLGPGRDDFVNEDLPEIMRKIGESYPKPSLSSAVPLADITSAVSTTEDVDY